jgi:hypothetical protein
MTGSSGVKKLSISTSTHEPMIQCIDAKTMTGSSAIKRLSINTSAHLSIAPHPYMET